jgi:hypothetical protein
MRDTGVEDLLSLDREVAQASAALAKWRARLSRDPEQFADEDAIAPHRRVAGKSTWDGLRSLTPTTGDAPLRDALEPWVATLVLARIGRDDEVAVARAVREARSPYRGEPSVLASWQDAWRGIASAKSPAQARLWLETAAGAAAAVGGARRVAAERRLEVARRLGLTHPWDVLGLGEHGSLIAMARRLLDATEDLARAISREAIREGLDAAEVFFLSVGREAGEGWPAHLVPRWLEELFAPGVAGLRIELPPLPAALGSASFARALRSMGFAIHKAMAPPAMPFTLAREPGSLRAHRVGDLLGGLAADVEWQVRALGIPRRAALRQARVLARTALFDARLGAWRVLLADDTHATPRDLMGELAPRLYGSPLDPRLAGAWPGCRRDEPSRFVALVESRTLARSLTEGFDVDWFRNPRAWTHIRALAASPAKERPRGDALASEIDQLARAFEGALG